MATRRVAGVLGGTALAAWAGVVGKNRYGAVNAEASRDETTTWDAQVDWFVVGAGSSGCVVATRLAKAFPSKRTLLVEAGDTDNIEEIQNAVDYFGKAEKVFGSDRDWSYATTQQKQLNTRALWWPRGKVLGGCSSFNTMVFLRGDKSDFDTWAKITGFPEWGFDGMLPFFKRIETHPGPKSVHGKDGPMTVAPLSDDSHFLGGAVHFVTKAFVSAAESLGICKNEDFALNGNLGAGPNDVNACAGRRCNSAAYLKSIGAYPDSKQLSCASTSPPNALHVWLCAQTTRIIFDENKRAVGVELKFVPRADDLGAASSSRELEGKLVTPSEDGCLVRIRVNKEVIVCSGAVNSPKLLMLSGVGPAAHLKSVGIPVVADLPGVGASLRDHLHVPMSYRIPQPVKPHSHSNICEGTLFTKVYPEETNPDYPSDLQVHCGTLFFHPDGFTPVGQGFTLTPSLIHPRSVGSLWLNSKDPDDFPVIEPHYLEDSYDMEVLKRGVKFTRKLGAKMLQVLGGEGKEHFPGHEVESDQAIEEYIRKYVGTMYHPACSAKMGAENDPVAVLDRTLKVRGGIQGVRVIDASSMPEIVGANTNATCLALGEKGAQIIIDEFILQACST